MRFRRFHRLYAAAVGYFWLPCPLCRQEFGGHEWRDIDGKVASVPDEQTPFLGHGICPDCTAAGRGHWPPLQREVADA